MANARLRTAEAELLGLHRVGDVEGWEIPSRYLQFLRGGPAEALVDVVRHNDQDVRSLARLLVHLETRLGDAERRGDAASGDLAGLARAFARERRLGEALDCLDVAIERTATSLRHPMPPPWRSGRRVGPQDRIRGGRRAGPPTSAVGPGGSPSLGGAPRTAAFDAPGRPSGSPWIERTCSGGSADTATPRRPGTRWRRGPGAGAIVAAIELAKLHEHRLGDRPAALAAVLRGFSLVERRRRIGRRSRRSRPTSSGGTIGCGDASLLERRRSIA